MSVLVEGCVEGLADAQAAARGGADRLELCADLSVGGTTPSAEVIRAVKARVFIPVFVMARPRGGSFVYDAGEVDATHRDIERVIAAGADGVVVGALTQSNEIDVPTLRGFVARAGGVPVTFHRAFDQTGDPSRALETLVDAGVQRVLTAGGQGTALEGLAVLRSLVEQAGDRIVVLAGGKVRGHNAGEIIARTGVRELHARCEGNASQIAEIVDVARSEP
ncbi:MAG TPA: copper homeostasis protein CutC [Gemmatimonadaceae bacterium]|jgi:copper homeostasis protein|nr:copper homeostasis protein CutC [Gemmatimonadaceae bacterium]